MIGLVDVDFLKYTTNKKIHPPNVEIMKLAAYYQLEERHFCRLLTLDEPNLERYDIIYVASELTKEIPPNYRGRSNVEFIGTAYTRGKYKKFDNSIIDYTLPRTFIYKEYLKNLRTEGMPAKEINNFLDGAYCRMYAGDEKLPIPTVLARKKVVIYDRDFFTKEWEKDINKIIKWKPSKIETIHPIICKNLGMFFSIRSYNSIGKDNEIILDLPIRYNEISIMLNKYERKFLAEINRTSNIFLPLGLPQGTKTQQMKNLIFIANMLYLFWSRGIPIKLKFIEPTFKGGNQIEDLMRRFVTWAKINVMEDRDQNFLDYIHWEKDKKSTTIVQKQLDDFFNYHSLQTTLFTTTLCEITRGKKWYYRK